MEDKEFDRLLKICRIKLNDKSKEKLKKDINEIIEYFNLIDNLNTDEEPVFHSIDIKGRMRDDEIKEFKNVKGLLRNTKTYRDYIVGPKI